MTVARLKELLSNVNDNAMIYLDDGSRCFSNDNSEVVCVLPGALQFENMVVLQTKNDFDVESELEARFEYYSENDWDELDAVMDLFEDGYTVEDFKYNDDRYMWIKEFAESHGLV